MATSRKSRSNQKLLSHRVLYIQRVTNVRNLLQQIFRKNLSWYLFLRLGLLTVLKNMTVFNMIVVETEGGGGVTDSRSEDWGEEEEEEEGEEGEGGFAATEKNRRKCRDMIGRYSSSWFQSRLRMRYGNRASQNDT